MICDEEHKRLTRRLSSTNYLSSLTVSLYSVSRALNNDLTVTVITLFKGGASNPLACDQVSSKTPLFSRSSGEFDHTVIITCSSKPCLQFQRGAILLDPQSESPIRNKMSGESSKKPCQSTDILDADGHDSRTIVNEAATASPVQPIINMGQGFLCVCYTF